VTFAQVRKMALAIAGVEDATSWGTAAFKAGGKMFARLKEDGESLVIITTFEERAELMAADPETYFIIDHYIGVPMVQVRLSRVSADAMRDLLNRAKRLAPDFTYDSPRKRARAERISSSPAPPQSPARTSSTRDRSSKRRPPR
jgi:hypothetical protein